MLKCEAIKHHLTAGFMATRYASCMEVQVNVEKGNGEPISGYHKSKGWQGFTNGLLTWKAFRIPFNAATNPNYTDRELKFPLSDHALAIGMTGWDYTQRQSRWVGFDFDSIVSHKEGLTNEELKEISERIRSIDWITICRSTSGNGLHVYVFIQDRQRIDTHTEHAAAARSILAKLSAHTGLELEAKVDCMGGNMWVWHKYKGDKGFLLIKQGTFLKVLPTNWRDYLAQMGRTQRIKTQFTNKDLLVASQESLALTTEHRKLIQWFEKSDALWWWDDSMGMLVCHTADLALAHTQLKLRGFFETLSKGKDHGTDQNCFCFPNYDGSWTVRRHSRNTPEHPTWQTTRTGWTTCYYNRVTNLRTASIQTGGIEGEKDYSFRQLSDALDALAAMEVEVPDTTALSSYLQRPATIKEVKSTNKIIVSFEHTSGDTLEGWSDKNSRWSKVFFRPAITDETEIPDDTIRHIVADSKDLGWSISAGTGDWIDEGRANVISALVALGHKSGAISTIVGHCVLHPWKLSNLPFQSEYPGRRRWNREAAQLKYMAKVGKWDTWLKILDHIGSGLKPDSWCIDVGITNGSIYLQAWVASIFQYPEEPLPYLALVGPQNCGKSILHEGLELLVTKGIIRADTALTNASGFNGELAGAILCVVEETNLSRKGFASDRIRDWVTGRTISIHAKGRTPYDMPNVTHWIQCSNDAEYCPILPGDTRITMIELKPFTSTEIPKPLLIELLEREAAAFLFHCLNFELPDAPGRLRLPVVESESKHRQQELNRSPVDTYFREQLHAVEGAYETFSKVYSDFESWLGSDSKYWSRNQFSRELHKLGIVKGKQQGQSTITVGNYSFNSETEKSEKFTAYEGVMIQ